MSTRLEQLVKEIAAVQARFKEEGKAALREGFKEFFEANPEVKAFGWTQYAPYFNDGEPCEFGVGDIYATKLDPEDEDFSGSELAHGEYSYGANSEETDGGEAADEFINLLRQIPEDMFRDLFGSDSLVVVTREGITVEDYSDHD